MVVAYLRVLRQEGHRSGDEEGVVAAGNCVVEAAFFIQPGTDDLQGAKCLQVLEMGILLRVICSDKSQNLQLGANLGSTKTRSNFSKRFGRHAFLAEFTEDETGKNSQESNRGLGRSS